jgi:hypothetical protein
MSQTDFSEYYHGTDIVFLSDLIFGKIDRTKGGGELGMGFYTSLELWVAKAWAANKYPTKAHVMEITAPDKDFYSLEPLILSKTQAQNYRDSIKDQGETHTYQFDRNVVWSPIVGTDRFSEDQVKWESKDSESLLNSNKVSRAER